VAAQQIDLQRIERIGVDAHLGERSEAGVDAIDGVVAGRFRFDHCTCPIDPDACFVAEGDRLVAVGDRHDVIERQ
jgi:hypothetical protein